MQDKGLHALSYFATVLSLLFAAVWRPGRGEGPLPRALGWIVAVAIGGGIAVEVLQASIGRTPEVADVVAETLGSMLAVLVHQVIRRWDGARRRRHDPCAVGGTSRRHRRASFARRVVSVS